MKYFDELKRSMEFLASDPRTVFIGQAVAFPGTAMSNTLMGVPKEKLVPVTIFPRWNFLLLAINQLVNHVDKARVMSNGGYDPKIIIRTGIGSERPLHPQHQHIGDFTDAIRKMCTTIEVIRLKEPEDIFPAYEKSLLRDDGRNTILVEYGDYYNEK